MATRDATKVERGPGRLVLTPTDLGIAFPHGGTELGAVRGSELEVMADQYLARAEEYGGIPVEGVSRGEWAIFYALFRQWDADALAKLFANTSTGAGGGKVASATMAAGVRSGAKLTDRASKILFVANDPAHESIYLPLAAAIVVQGSRIAYDISRERVISASWVAFPDATGRIYQVGKIGDITL